MSHASTQLPDVAFSSFTDPTAVEYRARGLLVALQRSPSSLDTSIPAGFDRLLRFTESLPLARTECAFARNWISGARALWEQGEPRAAIYQLKLTCKKLQNKDS
jgi:hypothetical protein